MRAEQVKGLMEAYSQVYEAPEVLSEGVVEEDIEVLDEAPMTAFQAAGGQAKLDQLNKGRSGRQYRFAARDIEKQGQDNLFKAGGGNAAIAKGPTRTQNTRGGRSVQVPTLTRQDIINKGTVAGAKPAAPAKPKVSNIPPAEGTGRGGPSDIRRGSTPTPSAPAAKPAATATSKPTTPAAPAKPAGSAMDQWAKANPKLAAAKAERDRTRGTSATTNPLMKDMKSSMSAPKSPAPSTASTGFSLAKKGVNLAAGVDIFDLVKGHLLDEGYADSEEGAMVIMVNMSEEWRKSILEAHGVEILDEVSKTDDGTRERIRMYAGKKGISFEPGPRWDPSANRGKGANLSPKQVEKQRRKALRKEDLELDESSKTDDGTRERIRMYAGKKGISFEPGPRWDPSANRGKGANLSDKQKEKQRRKSLRNEDLEAWVDQLIAEGYDLSEYTWEEVAEIYAEELQLMELTGGKGHPGYKAGSRDHGDLEDHPAVKKGGVLTPRHGEHLGDLDDEDDEDDELENIIRDRSRARRENVRKPLRDKVKAARKAMTKEEIELDEAQRARENPEDHDKEEKRKYEPVRGERTPMPPRGDKRREEFEKWYAKQMGR